MTATAEWNPYYMAFCHATGRPYEQRGRMWDFTIWNQEQWAEWRAENGVAPNAGLSEAQYAAYGQWLDARWPAPEPVEVGEQ